MSVSCPNPNHPDFIKLKEQLGEDEAYRQYMLNANEIPNPDLYENISSPEVNFSLKVTNALKSIADVRETIRLNTKESPYIETNLRKLLQGKGVYTEQIDFIFDYMKARNITEISTEQLAAELASEYSYTTKIDISKRNFERGEFNPETGEFGQTVENSLNNSDYYSNLTVPGGTNYTESEIATPDITPSIKGHAQFATEKGIGWFRSDDQELLKSIAPVQVTKEEYDAVLNNPTNVFGEFTEDGETYYTDENENRRYSRNKQGYFRQDVYQPNQAKTRRILEVQSDLFQKGRDRKDLLLSNNNRFKFTYNLSDFNIIYNFSNNSYKIVYSNNGNEPSLQYMPPKNIIEDVIKLEKDKIKASRNSSENQFLQLLNKSGNWVTFFIKSIIQDSAKKGYEKVLFPTGNTASKVEGHSTLEEFKKEKEERIKSRKEFLSELEKRNKTWVVVKGDKYEDKPVAYFDTEGETVKYIEDNDDLNLRYMSNNQVSINKEIEDINNEINQIKRELIKVETEGFAALRPIYNFYENTVTNILKKQGLNIKKIKDEYGNTWNEVNIKPQRDLNKILLRNVEEDDDIPLSDLQLYEHANKFFGKLKVPFQLMSEEELVLWNRANPDRAIGKDTKGFFDPSTNKVYLIKGRAGFYTTLHEFTHPLVEWVFRNNNPLFKTLVAKLKAEKGEQSFIDFLNQNGYTYLLQDGKMTDAAWKEVMTTEIEAASKSILNNAAVKPGSFLEAVKLFWKKIKEAISNLVSKDIGKLNDRQLLNLTINDLAVFMLDGDVKLDLHAPFSNSLSTVPNEAYGMLYYKNANTEFQTSVSRQTEEYKKRTGKDVTSNQLNVINTLLAYQGLVKGDDGYYDSVLDINYRRATEFLSTLKGPNGEENYFAYHGDENDEVGLKAAEWGNQVDELVQFILSGLDAQSAITQVIDNHNSRTVDNDTLAKAAISEEVLEELHETLKNYLGNKFKDYVVLTQVMLADSTTGVAGTADIVLISPDGKIKIVDIKTTKYSSEGTEYIKTYPLSSSKKQKHAGQLTIYKGIAKSMGLTIDESDDLAIIPVYFPDTNVEVIDEARLEPEVPIAAFEYILNMFETGDTEAMEETKSDDPEVNLIKQIKIILTKRLSDINKMPAGFKKSQAKIETETILDTLNQAESTKKLTEFVTGLHKQFTNQIKENKAGKKYTIYGLPSQIKYLTLELASGKITRDDALSKFLHIKNINDLYSPLLDDIRNIINSKDDTTVKSEMSNKLNEIQNGIAFIKKTYEEETVEIMADILVENVSEKANERAKTHLKTLKDRLNTVTSDKDKKKAQENYDSALRNLRSEEGITREVIIKALKEGSSKDIDWVDLWFTPAVTSSSELVAPFAMALKTKLEDARQELISFERQAGQAYERFGNFAGKGNPAEFNKGLYQTVEFFDKLDADGNPIYKQKQMFVSPVDLQKFHKVKGEFEKQLAAEEDPKKQNAIRSKFYSDNFVRKSEEDTVVINPITGERIVIEEGIKTLIEQKRQLYLKNIISEIDFNEFVKIDSVNPILFPDSQYTFHCPASNQLVHWQSKNVLNPTAFVKYGKVYLLYRAQDSAMTSRLGLAISTDGIHFVKQPNPVFYPDNDLYKKYEWKGGVEDPRIVETEDHQYLLTYTSYDGKTARLCFALSKDLMHWKKRGPVLSSERYINNWSKSGAIIVERKEEKMVAKKINGKYWMYFGDTDLFMAYSDDLMHWEPLENSETNKLVPVLQPRAGYFDSRLVEPGPFALYTNKGVVLIYNSSNAANNNDHTRPKFTYAAGQALYDTALPYKLVDRTNTDFIHPDKDYEKVGEVNNVCFVEGLVFFKNKWILYYGTADSKIAVAITSPKE